MFLAKSFKVKKLGIYIVDGLKPFKIWFRLSLGEKMYFRYKKTPENRVNFRHKKVPQKKKLVLFQIYDKITNIS
jgi:hypothetical protein